MCSPATNWVAMALKSMNSPTSMGVARVRAIVTADKGVGGSDGDVDLAGNFSGAALSGQWLFGP